MKFICSDCQQTMEFRDNEPASDGGSMTIRYTCPGCGRGIAMVTNPGETQMVRSLGVTIGHESLDRETAEPMSLIRGALRGQAVTATTTAGDEPIWTEAALRRLSAAPTFVQGMVRGLYTDYARQKGYAEVTPAIMTEAREALGLTGM
ncbi:MAG: hypothetical protein ACRDIB_19725 [Ardenticatenaceae bacterium]